MNKAERELFNNYKYARRHLDRTRSIWNIYEKPSDKKIEIYEKLEDERISVDGKEACCPTHNGWTFTYAYIYTDKDGIDYLIYHTPTHKYIIIIDSYELDQIYY